MNSHALVSVLLPAYNAEDHLERAVQSILQQSYMNFELIIINDGSSDGTWDLIESYNDPRINGINFEQNQGLVQRLNHGLKLAQGKYIARMDADDIALPKRLEMQVDFMDQHAECGACGTAIVNFGENGKTCKMSYPCEHNEIVAALSLFERNICHPTVMLRTSVLRENNIYYKSGYLHAEDYMLWVDISRYSMLNNLSEPLLMYYRHEEQISAKYYAEQMETSRRIIKEQLEDFLLSKARRLPENVYIDFLLQEINNTQRWITEAQSREAYIELLRYSAERESVDFVYARKILLFKALRASFQYNFSLIDKVKSAFYCLFKDPRLVFRNASEMIGLIYIRRLKPKV